ncbi:MAG: GNVR domain-containing protein, partial [Deltaproteobacteria bacterium]
INSEQEFYLRERLKLQKQLGEIRDSQEKILLEITNLTQKGVTTVNLVEGGSDINIMTQLKLRLGEKLADKALAFASNEQEKYQKLNKEIETLVNQESFLIEKLQKVDQKLLDLKNRRIEVINSATLPESPIKPKTRLIVALSAVVSLFVGIFLVFVIEFIKNAKSRLQENEEGLSPA